MTNFELLNQMYNDYFGISLEDDMKKKESEEIEMLATAPSEVLSEEQIRAENNERVQTCERALCGVLDRLDIIEKKLFLISEFYEKRNEHKHTIWELLEHKGLVERGSGQFEGMLMLTTKGRQVASLFDNCEIEDIRE